MNDNEKLIEEAAATIAVAELVRTHRTWGDLIEPQKDEYRRVARATLAVFEKAHTPTDDEREELAQIIADAESHPNFKRNPSVTPFAGDYRAADEILAAGFRRSEVPEPSAETDDEIDPEECKGCGELNSECRCDDRPKQHTSSRWAETVQIIESVALDQGSLPRHEAEQIADAILARSECLHWTPEPQGEPSDALPLDPQPWVLVSDQVFGVRSATDKGFHAVSGAYYAFQPGREYEQDRARYESAEGAK